MKLATAGAGYFSQFQFEAWSRIPEVELVGMYNRRVDRLAPYAVEYGNPPVFDDFGRMLESVKPDIVDVITPPVTHHAFVEQALDAGCHVICQKPFTRSMSEARDLIAKAKQANRMLVVHENFRFQPWYREIARLLGENLLGDLYQATFRLRPGDGQGENAYRDRQPFFRDMERFLIHETGVHLVDTFRYLFGPCDWVYADLRRLNPGIAGEDAGTVIFGYDSGFRAVFDGNRLSDHRARNQRLTMGELTVEGAKGTLELTGDAEIRFRPFASNDAQGIAYEWHDRGFGADCVYALQRHVIDHLTKGTALANAAEDYFYVMTCEAAIYRSAEIERRTVLSEIEG